MVAGALVAAGVAGGVAAAASAGPAAASGWHFVHPRGAEAGAPPPAHQVVLFGDSLSDEADAPFVFAAALDGYVAETHVGGGTAPCDWLPDLQALVARPAAQRPTVAVIEFTGNAFTACMRPDGTAPAPADILAAYARDATTYITTLQAAGIRPVFALAPAVDHPSLVPQVNALWRQLAAEYPGVGVVDAGATVEASDGSFTQTLPCAPWEGAPQGCFFDRVIVRAPDGTHFCPTEAQTVNGVVGVCPVPNPGAVRYAMGLAEALTPR